MLPAAIRTLVARRLPRAALRQRRKIDGRIVILAWTPRGMARRTPALPVRPGADIGRTKLAAGKLPFVMDKSTLLGTWRLKSYVVTRATGERSTPYGENPTGYLSYSADNRMQVIGVAEDRRVPIGARPPDNERIALYDTMFAYAGTFSVEDDKIIHHIDISWNESWTGTDQVRALEVSGAILTLTTHIRDPVSGVENHYAVAWERISDSS